jgi:hypothetical protein
MTYISDNVLNFPTSHASQTSFTKKLRFNFAKVFFFTRLSQSLKRSLQDRVRIKPLSNVVSSNISLWFDMNMDSLYLAFQGSRIRTFLKYFKKRMIDEITLKITNRMRFASRSFHSSSDISGKVKFINDFIGWWITLSIDSLISAS